MELTQGCLACGAAVRRGCRTLDNDTLLIWAATAFPPPLTLKKKERGETLWVNLNGRMHYGRLLGLRQSSQEVFLWASIRLRMWGLIACTYCPCVVVIVAMFTATPGLFFVCNMNEIDVTGEFSLYVLQLNWTAAMIVICFELEGELFTLGDLRSDIFF